MSADQRQSSVTPGRIELRVKVTTCVPHVPLVRQTREGMWGNCRFYIDDDDCTSCNAWVVFDGLTKPERAVCPPANTLFITGEPPGVKQYPAKFLNQFSTVISCHRDLDHPNVVNTQQGMPWLYGLGIRKNAVLPDSCAYDELDKSPWPSKTREISVISSSKADLEGQRQRGKLVRALREHFGDAIDIFGRGVRDFIDKRDVIDPYKYHIALENTRHSDYWTEKLADAYLGGAYPIYWGCPNITDYFPADAITSIDAYDPGTAIAVIQSLLRDAAYERSRAALSSARRLVLDRYNLFAVAADFARACKTGLPRRVEMRPAPNHGIVRRLVSGLKATIHGKV